LKTQPNGSYQTRQNDRKEITPFEIFFLINSLIYFYLIKQKTKSQSNECLLLTMGLIMSKTDSLQKWKRNWVTNK